MLAIVFAELILINNCHGCKGKFDYKEVDPFFLSLSFFICVYINKKIHF